jgi:integrase
VTRSKLLTQDVADAASPRSREYALHDAQAAGLALRIRPSGVKTWVLRRRYNGKARRITLGAIEDMTLQQARAIVFGEEIVTSAARSDADSMPPAVTLMQLVTKYLADIEGPASATTLKAYRSYLRTQLLPNFGNIPINRLSTPALANWFHTYSRTSPGGANQAMGILRTMLNYARTTGVLPVDAPDPTSPIRRNPRPPRGRLLSSAQLKDLGQTLAAAPQRNRWAADAIRLILLTGCRSGEIIRLKWSEVEIDRLLLGRTKTGPREQLLSQDAVKLLRAMRRQRLGTCVFPGKDDVNTPTTGLPGQWLTFRKRAGLPDDIRLHDLRHSYASHSVMSGESVTMTGKLLGHRNSASTERYAHLDGAYLSAAADRVSERVAKVMGH